MLCETIKEFTSKMANLSAESDSRECSDFMASKCQLLNEKLDLLLAVIGQQVSKGASFEEEEAPPPLLPDIVRI